MKAGKATRTRMTVIVPASLAKYLTVKAGVAVPTRFRVRVLARHLSKGYTALKRSPFISPANGGGADGLDELDGPLDDCHAGGIVDSVDGDDNALLGDELEAAIETDPCSVNSVGDGLQDDGE